MFLSTGERNEFAEVEHEDHHGDRQDDRKGQAIL